MYDDIWHFGHLPNWPCSKLVRPFLPMWMLSCWSVSGRWWSPPRKAIPLLSSKIPPRLGNASCCQLCRVREPSRGFTIRSLSGSFQPSTPPIPPNKTKVQSTIPNKIPPQYDFASKVSQYIIDLHQRRGERVISKICRRKQLEISSWAYLRNRLQC